MSVLWHYSAQCDTCGKTGGFSLDIAQKPSDGYQAEFVRLAHRWHNNPECQGTIVCDKVLDKVSLSIREEAEHARRNV